MSVSADAFLGGLERAAVKPVYLIAGAEPLLVQECADALRAKLRAAGFSERIVLDSDGLEQWTTLQPCPDYRHLEATELLEKKLRDSQLAFNKKIDQIKAREIERVGLTADAADALYRESRLLIASALITLILLGASLSWGITHSIVGPKRGYTSALPSATKQNFSELPDDR